MTVFEPGSQWKSGGTVFTIRTADETTLTGAASHLGMRAFGFKHERAWFEREVAEYKMWDLSKPRPERPRVTTHGEGT